jgi:hypothetical protein
MDNQELVGMCRICGNDIDFATPDEPRICEDHWHCPNCGMGVEDTKTCKVACTLEHEEKTCKVHCYTCDLVFEPKEFERRVVLAWARDKRFEDLKFKDGRF